MLNDRQVINPAKKGVTYTIKNKSKKQNKSFNPRAVKILNNIRSDWKNYANKIQYTETGKLKYRKPTDFDLDVWNPEDLPKDSISVMIVGKRRTGKSVFTKDFLLHLYKIGRADEIYVFTGTKVNDWYQSFMHDCYINDGWDTEKIGLIFARAETLASQKKSGKIDEIPSIVIICDDLLSEPGVREDKNLEKLYTKGRHYGISIIFISQKFKGVTPRIRDNTDLVVSFTMFNQNEGRQLAEEFLGGLNLRTAMEIMDLYASEEQHTCLVIETWRNKKDPELCLKWYQAELHEDLKPGQLGSKEYNEGADGDSQKVDSNPTEIVVQDIRSNRGHRKAFNRRRGGFF